MKNILMIFYALIVLSSLGSCSKQLTQLSAESRYKYRIDDNKIKRIQLYNGEEIILEKELESFDSQIIHGKLIIENGVAIDRIIIKKETRGAALQADSSARLTVCFEPDAKYTLPFGLSADKSPVYVMYAQPAKKGEPKFVYYGGATSSNRYRVVNEDINLYFDLRELDNTKKKERVAKGRKIK